MCPGGEATWSRWQYLWALWSKHPQTPPSQSPSLQGKALILHPGLGASHDFPRAHLSSFVLSNDLSDAPCCHHTRLLTLLWAPLSFQDPVLSTQALCPLCPETLCSAQVDERGQVLTGVFRWQGDKAGIVLKQAEQSVLPTLGSRNTSILRDASNYFSTEEPHGQYNNDLACTECLYCRQCAEHSACNAAFHPHNSVKAADQRRQ